MAPITWPPSLGGIIAIVVLILILLLIILKAVTLPILAGCVAALALARIL